MRRALGLALLLTVSGAVVFSLQAAQTQMAANLRIDVEGVTRAGGTLRVALYDEATFSLLSDFALVRREVPRIAGDTAVSFERLPPGTYAVKVLQDVNNNGRGDEGEPKGLSNDARDGDFEGAALVLAPGDNRATIRLR